MESRVDPGFWKYYRTLSPALQRLAKKTYRFWRERIDDSARQDELSNIRWHRYSGADKDVFSVDITAAERALCFKQGSDYVWFYIGRHLKPGVKAPVPDRVRVAKKRPR